MRGIRGGIVLSGFRAGEVTKLQIWLTKSYEELGWSIPLPPDGTPLADTCKAPARV